MKSFEKSWRCEGSMRGARRGTPQPPPSSRRDDTGASTVFGFIKDDAADKYLSARDSVKLNVNVSVLIPRRESDSATLLIDCGLYLTGESSDIGSEVRDAMLVLMTGRRTGGEARRGGVGASVQLDSVKLTGGVPGERPGTAVCYGHCWYNGNGRLVKQ